MTNKRIQAWQDLRFGMFIHFGLYSMLGGVWQGKMIDGYNEQILSQAPIQEGEYEQLAKQFNPVNFDADAIAELAVEAGMKYIVITAKHHDGFCLFHSKHTEYNIIDATPYGKDLVLELSEACAKHNIGLGIYFSWIDWHYPHAAPMSNHNSDPITDKHMEYNLVQIEELLTKYGPIVEVWFDMGAPTAEQSREMAKLVHHLQPLAMVNGRIWNGQEDFAVLGDNEIPDFLIDGPWQTPASIYHATWGYRSWQERTDLSGKIKEQTFNLSKVLELGGNYLLNIGPKGDGSIVDFEAAVLRGLGQWAQDGISNSISQRKRIVLKSKDAETLFGFQGKDYYSNKPVAAKKRWLVNVTQPGIYEISVEM